MPCLLWRSCAGLSTDYPPANHQAWIGFHPKSSSVAKAPCLTSCINSFASVRRKAPHDMRDCNIITLYKNKGDRSNCINYRGVALLAIVGKVFARVLLNRLQQLADRVCPESQCGFRSQRSTIDMIFSLRQLQ